MPFETLYIFILASSALAFAPGPDNIFVLTQSAIQGRLAGIFVTLGLCTGLLFHTAAVAAGVAAIFATSALAFTLLKIVGAAYLAYLAYKAFRAGITSVAGAPLPKISARKLYVRGVIMNITNPKVAIFFLAFLPQFADPTAGSVTTQILALGAVFMGVALVCFSAIAWFSGTLGEKLGTSPRAQIILNRVAGTVFAGLAVKLALVDQ